ncbi:MAG TPA: hypothetical protein VFU16_03395 [Solirubrobacterales bacterium]|nr:hypothetical protein [Solirubrobacterales bacterium]
MSAKVGGGQLKVASTRRLSVSRSGFGSRLTSSDLALTAKAATRLNKKLRPEAPFTAGQAIGRIVAKAQPATIAVLPKGKLSLVPAPEILSKFRSLFVSLNPIAPAELAAGPVFTFPLIADGSIAPDASTGEIRVGGELEFLQLSGGQVFWYEDWFDLGTGSTTAETILQPSPPYAGKLGRIGILGLSPNRDAVGDPGARTVTVNGQILTLTPATASSFNELFAQGDPVFQPGETFGTIAFQAAGQ